MLISKSLEEAVNQQIGREFAASLGYVNIAAWFDADSLPQLAAFFYRQADEERMHAMKFVHYVAETGGHVSVPAIAAGKSTFESAEAAVALALELELKNTGAINALMDMAVEEKDHILQDFLRWFVTEQREEVATMSTLLSVVKRARENLLWVEDYLARTPAPTVTGGGPAEAA